MAGNFIVRKLSTKFEVSLFIHYDYEDTKGNAKQRNWGGLHTIQQRRVSLTAARSDSAFVATPRSSAT